MNLNNDLLASTEADEQSQQNESLLFKLFILGSLLKMTAEFFEAFGGHHDLYGG